MNSGERGEPVIIKGYPSLFAGADCFEECDGFYERPRLSPRPRADLFPLISAPVATGLVRVPLSDIGAAQWGYNAGVNGELPYPFTTRYEGIATEDEDASYAAHDGPAGSGGSYTDRYGLAACPVGRTWRIYFTARALGVAVGSVGLVTFRHTITDEGGNRFDMAPFDAVGMGTGWTSYTLPATLQATSQPNPNSCALNVAISAFFPGTVLVSTLRILSP